MSIDSLFNYWYLITPGRESTPPAPDSSLETWLTDILTSANVRTCEQCTCKHSWIFNRNIGPQWPGFRIISSICPISSANDRLLMSCNIFATMARALPECCPFDPPWLILYSDKFDSSNCRGVSFQTFRSFFIVIYAGLKSWPAKEFDVFVFARHRVECSVPLTPDQ